MKEIYFFKGNPFPRLYRWPKLLTVFMIFFMAQIGFAQSIGTQTFSVSGTDAGNAQIVITPGDLTVNEGQPVQNVEILSLTYLDEWGNHEDIGVWTCDPDEDYYYYAFDLAITGGVSDGHVVNEGCVDDFTDVNVTGFSNITVTAQDVDDYPDGLTFSITLEVTYETPACPAPAGFQVTGTTSETASLSWTSAGSDFEVEYGPAGFAEGNGTTVPVSGTSTTLTGLTTSQPYEAYVRQDCGGTYSSWVGPVAFTPSSTVTYTAGNINTLYVSSNPNTSTVSTCPGIMTIQVPPGKQIASLTVEYSMTTAAGAYRSEQRSYIYSPTMGTGESSVVSGSGQGGTHNYSRALPFAAGATGTVEFELRAFRTWGGSGCNATYNYVVNNTWKLTPVFEDIPACIPPASLTASPLHNSAVLGWTSDGDDFDIKWGPTGFNVETEGTLAENFTNGGILNGLSPQTAYQFYVRQDCGGDGLSTWAGPIGFTTTIAPAAIPWNEGFATTSTPAGWTTTGWTIGTFARVPTLDGNHIYKNLYGSVPTGTFTTINVTGVSTGNVLSFDYILTDWSNYPAPPLANSVSIAVNISVNGGAFGLLTTITDATATAGWQSFQQDLSAYAGQTIKIQIVANWVADDFVLAFDNFFIGAPPSCFAPTNVSLVIADGFSAEFSWEAAAGENIEGYNWVVVADGADPDVDTPVASGNTTGLSAVATGLSPVTAYDFYVRTDCGTGDGESLWSKVDFTTTVACPAPTGGTVSNRTAISATLNWNSTGDNFIINWGTGTFVAGEGANTETGIAGTSFTFPDNLNPSTTYRWFVRQDCGVDGTSTWAGPYTFTTLLANDNIEDAIPVSCGETYTGSTATATNDQPNPAIFGVASTLSPNVWYSYTGSGEPEAVTLSLCNSGYDTAILVATGEPGNLTWIAGNDDYCGTSGHRSQVEFNSDGTTTYWIMVRGYGAASTGTYELVVSCAEPCLEPNDEVANAEPIEIGIPFDSENTCASASPEAYPSCGSPFSSYSDVWYSFNSGANDVVKLSLTPQTDVAVGYAVYSGTPGSLTQIGCNTTGLEATLNLNLYENYYIRVYSTVGESRGEFTINLTSEHSYIVWTTDDEWSNVSGPTSTDDVFIIGDLNVNSDLELNNLVVSATGTLNVLSGQTLSVSGSITNNSSDGASGFVVSNEANLIQTMNTVNTANITVIRESQEMIRLDYTMWSSPVIGQNLFGFSPMTVNGVTNHVGSEGRIYIYDGNAGYVNPQPFDENLTMAGGLGYLFRVPNDWSSTEADSYVGIFTGAPNNGNIVTTTHAGNYTSIGNPYPSNISVNSLYAANPGINTLYLWNNNHSSGNNYATCTNGLGCVAAAGGGNTPNGIITVGQGFIVHTDDNSVAFDNSMRVNNSGIFFKVDELESHRIWLNLNGDNEEKYNQILVGYVSEATNNVDPQIDGKLFGYQGSALYNIIEEEQFVIQGRALPFEASDVVPLGFRAAEEGRFKISLADFDGLFAEGAVTIYLKDNQLDVYHNLMESDYVFESVQGTFKERFEVVYETEGTMGTGDFDSGLVQIYQHNNHIVVSSKTEKILSVELFDLQGRNIHRNAKVNANLYQIPSASFGTQVLVVKVQTQNGEILTKKIINK